MQSVKVVVVGATFIASICTHQQRAGAKDREKHEYSGKLQTQHRHFLSSHSLEVAHYGARLEGADGGSTVRLKLTLSGDGATGKTTFLFTVHPHFVSPSSVRGE